MTKIRKMLTETLLEVTNEEIDSVAGEVYEEEKGKMMHGDEWPRTKINLGISEIVICCYAHVY